METSLKYLINVDVDRLPIPEIKYKVKKIRITTHKFFLQRISNLDLVTRSRTLYSDSDVLDMVGCFEKSNSINIFVDHHVVPNIGISHPIYLLTDKEVYESVDEEENESEESRFMISIMTSRILMRMTTLLRMMRYLMRRLMNPYLHKSML